MRTILFLLLSSLFFTSAAGAQVDAVEASVDNNPVMVDEAIRLTVTAQGDASREAFDSSPLLKDFVVGRTSVSSRTSIVNFNSTQTTVWTTTLFPRATGTFTIPAFTIEGKQTQPIQIKVIPVSQGSGQASRDYFVTTSVDTSEVYLHQQIHYTAKLHLATRIEQGALQSPELENAEVRQIGDDKQYTDIVDGKRFQIIERNFAIIPQQSGSFTIRGPVFTGEVVAPNTNQRFGFFNRTQQVNRVGPDISIEVKAVPDNISYHWLPSEYVQLDEEWPEGETLTVGEPITRTITLTAMGVVEEQLPELPQRYPPDFKLYPDQANTATVERDNTLIAQRVESLAIIPTQPGQYVLPDVTVSWFNVLTGETEKATLPARTISVAPAPGTSTPSVAAQPPVENVTTSQSRPEKGMSVDAEPSSVDTPPITDSLNLYLLAALIASCIGWLATVLYFRRKLGGNLSARQTAKSGISAEDEAFRRLLRTVETTDNVGDIQRALTVWVAALLPGQQAHVAMSTEPALHPIQQHMNTMLASRYGNSSDKWNKKSFRGDLKAARNTFKQQRNTTGTLLPPLYPGVK
ncbi:BatD family protein [Alteromonas sp. H39]|uniref:BatD family protein n=1 Tax=Alteromonas sp. H39 TaxID=3389876 RepID=UPI0039DFE274